MNGLSLSRAYFYEMALPLLRRYMPDVAARCAAGLCAGGLDAGSGSEIYGFDDEQSRDHNWGPRFFLFLPEEDYERRANDIRSLFLEKLSPAFKGHMLKPTTNQSTHFHITTPLRNALAVLDIERLPQTDTDWYVIPECRLCEYAAGDIYYDPLDIMSPLKRRMARYPQNVLYKRIAGAFFMMHTAGNALRCARRAEYAAARGYADMAAASARRAALLLSGRYVPHIKWRARAVRELGIFPEWIMAMERMSLVLPPEPERLDEALLAILRPVGEMANASGLIGPIPLTREHAFLSFPCYEFSKAFEAKISGELSGRQLAVALDQMSEGCQPFSTRALRAHWEAGRPGISRLV